MSADPDITASPARLRDLEDQVRDLTARLEESEDTLAAIRRGDFDAIVVQGPDNGRQVYTLENADRPYRVLIEQIQEGALTLGADGTVLYCNRRLAEMVGIRQEALIGQQFGRFMPDGDAATLALLLEQATASPVRAELNLRDEPDGPVWPVYLSLSQLERHENQPLFCGVVTDLAEQKLHLLELAEANTRLRTESAERERIEEVLRQSQKMEAVGQLTGGVAHDFNNLLTVIKSSTDLLKRPDLPEERRTRYVGAISDTVARAAKLTGQLLAFARRQALKPEVFDVGASVAAVGDMLGTLTGARVQIVTHLPEAPCYIHADPSQFDTAVVNIAVNARDAMEGQGALTIAVRPVDRVPAMPLQPAVRGAFVAIAIADTGIGIAPDNLTRIFEPFFTTKGVGQGTGLGLSQVFGFTKQSGGEVVVESELGRGTTFTLYLPRAEKSAPAVPMEDIGPTVDGTGTCVLVVEDNAEVGSFATQTLEELGYDTVWVRDADAALAALEAIPLRFDVVFSDVVMPGMNGVELARAIRRRHVDLPVVLTSGYSHVLAEEGAHEFALLHKPYSVEELSRELSKAVAARRRRGAPA